MTRACATESAITSSHWKNHLYIQLMGRIHSWGALGNRNTELGMASHTSWQLLHLELRKARWSRLLSVVFLSPFPCLTSRDTVICAWKQNVRMSIVHIQTCAFISQFFLGLGPCCSVDKVKHRLKIIPKQREYKNSEGTFYSKFFCLSVHLSIKMLFWLYRWNQCVGRARRMHPILSR